MKPFNLQEALNGVPVLLRNGCKAFVVQDIRKTFDQYELHCPETIYPLLIICDWAYWRETADGKEYRDFCINTKDIIGMWEDIKLTSEQVLEKAYQEDLMVLCDGNPDLPLKVIAKTKDGEFILQPERNSIQPWIANMTMEWVFCKYSSKKNPTQSPSRDLSRLNQKNGDAFRYLTWNGQADCSYGNCKK